MRWPSRLGISIPAFIVLLLVCWWAFAFSFLRTDFIVDDFEHLSRARQVLAGELPDRDFYDDGRPLTIALAVVAQRISPTLLSELIYRAAFIAAGVGFVYLLTLNLTRSKLLSILAALITIGLRPRLYNYPKVFIFPFGIWLLWRYVERPTRGRLVALTAGTVVAFLFRHDFGLYLAFVSVCTIVGVHRREALKPLVLYAALGTTVCLPYLAWVAVQGRLVTAGSKGATAMATKAPLVAWFPIHMDLSRGLAYIRPPAHHVVVRWGEQVDGATRETLEHRYGLDPVETKADGRSVVYIFNEPTADRIGRLLSDARVEDTSGIDRGRGDRLDPPPADRWQAAFPPLRLTAARIFHSVEDAEGWLFNLFFLSVPLACLILFAFPDSQTPHAAAKILSLALLCVLIHHFLFIDKVRAHLPNVTGPTVVLVAWLVRRSMDGWRSLPTPWSWMVGSAWMIALPMLMMVTWLGVTTFAGTDLRGVLTAGVAPREDFGRLIRDLDRRPLDRISDHSLGRSALIRYIARCLSPEDRLLLVGYQPDVFYVSERLFAGGINAVHDNGFNSSGTEILRRLRGQSVPLIVVEVQFPSEWEPVAHYVSARYREAAVTTFDGVTPFHILADSQRPPVRLDPQWGLPCFTDH